MSIVQRVMDNGSETIGGQKICPVKRRREKQWRVIKLFLVGNIYFAKVKARYMDISSSPVFEIVKHGSGGDQVLAELEPPTIFGEMALIDGSPRSAGAQAKGDAVVTEVTAESFVNYLRQNPEAAIRIMKTISENLRTANQLVARYESLSRDASQMVEVNMNEADASHDHEINDTDAIYKQGPSKPLLISTISLLAFFILGVVFAALTKLIQQFQPEASL